MTTEHGRELSPRMQAALTELQDLIRGRYPDAVFRVGPSPDEPEAVILKAVVDVEDRDEVMDVVIERMMELQIEEGLPLFIVPVRPHERSLAMRRAAARPAAR